MNDAQDEHSISTGSAAGVSGPESVGGRSWKLSGLQIIPWVLLAVVSIAIAVVRSRAAASDHAVANLMTAGLLLFAWLLVLAGCYMVLSLRTIFTAVLIAPFLCALVYLSMFKFDRLDSELIPHFESRWQSTTLLPVETSGMSAQSVDHTFEAGPDDFPQFLGPHRDARIDATIDADWTAHPPEIAWKQPIGEGWSGFAVQGNAAITMEQRGASEWVSAYSILDGSLLWKYEIPGRHTTLPGGTGPRSTPAIAGDRVFAASAVSEFVCLDLRSGKKLWSQSLLDLAGTNQQDFEAAVVWGRAGSPLIIQDKAIVPLGGADERAATLIAFRVDTGQELWRGGQGQITYSSPVLAQVDGTPQILFVSEQKAAGYDPQTGRQLWEIPWPGHSDSDPAIAQPVIVDKNRLLLGKGYSEGAMLIQVQHVGDQWNAERVWKNKTVMKTKFTTAVVRNGYAYGLSDGILECIEIDTGKRQWKRGRYRHGQLLLVGEHLIILSEEGVLVLLEADPQHFRELASMPVISDVSWNTIALSGKRLLLRNSKEAACVLLPVEREPLGMELNAQDGPVPTL